MKYFEGKFRHHKFTGIVFRGDEDTAPELQAIFVPICITLQRTAPSEAEDLISLFNQYPYLVLLGGPGSGKSTTARYLAWIHAKMNLVNSSVSTQNDNSFLLGKPVPLYIELRQFHEARRQRADYSFLSYATEVMLGREDTIINQQMFQELLERKAMLLLFDGLDEVPTLDERRRLIDEIEYLSQRFPGNRILVTSRPVGYDIARFSNCWFQHSLVEDFNNDQIHQYLEAWYNHVLKYSSIPTDVRQELENFHLTLTTNPRLHKLATNPLLLTVMTALHRYKRLPDKRVQIYEECADLLIDTWAKLKHEGTRWKDVKMGKESQTACIAHLGFILHTRSQENTPSSNDIITRSVQKEDTATDVPARFILREIELFLKDQKLFTGAEQEYEAERFLELAKTEAGLIVERGTDEDGEALYGFVHRTFQEYFAAVDVYERYQQDDDSSIIGDFLKQNLHDPHWHEVILLLFGKLKHRQATSQLRRILRGDSHLSKYSYIVQHDLLFICDCLSEDITVENDFAQYVIESVKKLIVETSFSLLRHQLLEKLGKMIRTRQYTNLATQGLTSLILENNDLDLSKKIFATSILYNDLPSSGSQNIFQLFEYLIYMDKSKDEKVFEQLLKIIIIGSTTSSLESAKWQQSIQFLMRLAQRSENSFDEVLLSLRALFYQSHPNSIERGQAKQLLLQLVQRPNLSFEQILQAANTILEDFPMDSTEREQFFNYLLQLIQNSNYSYEQLLRAFEALLEASRIDSNERKQAIQLLIQLARHPNLSFEQTLQAARTLYRYTNTNSNEREQINQLLLQLVQPPNLSFEQALQVAKTITGSYPGDIDELEQINQLLLQLVQLPNLSFEQALQVAETIMENLPSVVNERKQIIQHLIQLAQRPDLSFKQTLQVARTLYRHTDTSSKERKQINQLFIQLAHTPNLSFEQTLQLARTIIENSPSRLREREQINQLLLQLVQLPNLSFEQALQVAETIMENLPSVVNERKQIIQHLIQLAQRPDLSFEQTLQVARTLYRHTDTSSKERKQINQLLLQLAQPPNLSFEQALQVIEIIIGNSPNVSNERKQAIQLLIQLARRPDLSFEETLQAARTLYRHTDTSSKEQQWVMQLLLQFAKRSDLPFELVIEIAEVICFQQDLTFEETDIFSPISRLQLKSLSSQITVSSQITIENIFGTSIQNIALNFELTSKEFDELNQTVNRHLLESREDVAPIRMNRLVRDEYWRLKQKRQRNEIGYQQGIQLLLQLIQRPNLSFMQGIQAVKSLYRYSSEGTKEREKASNLLLQLADKSDLSSKQLSELAILAYIFASSYSKDELVAFKLLWKLVNMQHIPIQRRLQAVTLPFRVMKTDMSYLARAEVVELILFLLPPEKARIYLSQEWLLSHRWSTNVSALDIPYIIELANQEALPKSVRDGMYRILLNAIPQYGYIGYQKSSQKIF